MARISQRFAPVPNATAMIGSSMDRKSGPRARTFRLRRDRRADDPTVPKHKGLSYFYVDMKAPGVEIKPIKQLTGESDFNEVYFTDVRVADSQRLGEVGQGWQVSLTTLMNERAAIGGGFGQMDAVLAMSVAQELEIDGRPALEDSAVRAKIANWYVQESGLKYTGYRSLTALSRGELPGPENSLVSSSVHPRCRRWPLI